MRNENAWTYGPTGLPVENVTVHDQPTLVMRPVPSARRWRRVVLRSAIVLVILVLLLIGMGIFLWFNPPALGLLDEPFLPPQANVVPWNGTDPVNILAMGVDQRVPGEQTHSDTIIVISVDPSTGHVRLVSIPRDLAVSVPGYGLMSKINEGYYLGGPRYEAYTVEHALGIPINYYAVLRFSSFEHLIDALGGVNITVDRNINDPTYPAPVGYGYAPLVLHAGSQHMNGATALAYMRERHVYTNGGDEVRVMHQQQLIDSMKSQMLSLHTLLHLPSVLSALRGTIVTNLPNNMLPVVGVRVVQDRHLQHIYFNEANHMVSQCVGLDQGADLCPSPAFWTTINSLFTNQQLAAEHATVYVENGTTMVGEAEAVAKTLTTCHFAVAGVGSADNSHHAHTAVIVNSAQLAAPYTTRLLRQMFGARLLTRDMPNVHAQLVLLLGNDMPRTQ